MTFIEADALHPSQKKIISTDNYDTLIDFLQEHYPDGFDMPTDIFTMFRKIELDDYDMKLNYDDIIILVKRPAVAAALGITSLWAAWLVNTAVMIALNFVVTKLFAPDAPKEQAQPSSVYNVTSGQNTAKFGSPIPVIYGKVRMYPSMIVHPYYKFENNIEYLYHILCVGQGTNIAHSVQIGEDTITTPGDLQYKLLYQNSFTNIPSNAYGIHITRTLSSPSNLELEEGVLTEEYTIKQGTQYVEFDYHYPNGIYATTTGGDYDYATAAFTYYIRSSTGTLLASDHIQDAGNSADPIQKTITVDIGGVTVSDYVTISFQQDVTIDNPGYSEKNYVKRVKEIYWNKDYTNLYGDITLLAVKIKATNAVSSEGQVKVNGFFERGNLGNRLDEVLTDIYTNTTYGGKLNSDDLYYPAITERVNGAFETAETVYDAMNKVAKAQKYSIIPVGQDILVKQDAPKTTTVALYNETNIMRDSFNIVYSFKDEIEQFDCVEVSYRTDDKWEPATERYPTDGISPQLIELFGVTTQAMAETMATYLYKQDAARSKVVSFKTDIQGFTLEFLDKIKISHSAVIWGEAGNIVSVNGSILTTSEPVTESSNITIRNTDTTVSDMLTFTKISDYSIDVTNLPVWVEAEMAYTIGVAKEYLVTSVKPNDENSVSVECVEYNEEIYS